MPYELDFTHYYTIVRPIVLRLHKTYYIKLWERDDWEQEGMLTLYHLLHSYPELMTDESQLRIYFKTKFSNHINDELRKQESQKRQFNKLAYEDISEVGHLVPCQDMILDDYVVFMDSLAEVKAQLTADELILLDRLPSGECFKGRKKLVKKLQVMMAS